ncbi:hypothetical protein [Nocardia fusca]|nr:hypothetical protein [Nocardia fusca]
MGRALAARLAVVAQEAPPETPATVTDTVLLGLGQARDRARML